MVWSFSASRMFQKCQRQWYFKNRLANALAKKEPERREAYLLSTLQSVSAWRGSVVDQTFTEHIVPTISRHVAPNLQSTLAFAHRLFEDQLTFAKANRMREEGMTKTKAGLTYAALEAIEYGLPIFDAEIEQAWEDIKQAVVNVLDMKDLWKLLSRGSKFLAQRALTFTCEYVQARMVPDLIVFFPNEAPLIVDWKVHTFGTSDYRLQLASYALALTKCEPHVDFPISLDRYTTTDIRLLEVQLLTKQLRSYELSQEDIDFVESYIVRSHMAMQFATEGRDKLSVTDVSPASNPSVCEHCPFRSMCWSKVEAI